jgi:hypothetical protein
MLRIGLAIYLALVTAAGPWLCCCTVTRLVSPAPPQKHTGAPAAPSSCCHHEKSPAANHELTPGNAPHDQPAHPRRDPCPCRTTLLGAEVPKNATSDVALTPTGERGGVKLLLLSAQLLIWSPSSVDEVFQTRRGPTVWPGPTSSRDLLCLLHILRC